MTAAACCTVYGHRPSSSLAVVAAVAVAIAAVAAAAATTATTATATATGGPMAGGPMTFESGETATEPPDDALYLVEEVVIALNATAAAAGDYAYEDYDTSTDVVSQTLRGRHHASKPEKHVGTAAAVPTTTMTITAAAVPTTTTTMTITAAAVPTTTSASAVLRNSRSVALYVLAVARIGVTSIM